MTASTWVVRIIFGDSGFAMLVQKMTTGIRLAAAPFFDTRSSIRSRLSSGFELRFFTMVALLMQGRGVSVPKKFQTRRVEVRADLPRILVSEYDWTCQ